MTTQQVIDAVCAWVQERVASRLEYCRADVLEDASGNPAYTPTLVHPAVYAVQIPPTAAEHGADTTAEHAVVAPCCIVTACGDGSFDLAQGWVETPLEFRLQVWWPGTWVSHGTATELTLDARGWRDATSFCDALVKELADAESVGGLAVLGALDIELPDPDEYNGYPYYRAVVRCRVRHARRPVTKFNI